MSVPVSVDDLSPVFLSADHGSGDPGVLENFGHRGSFLRIDFQHTANDMSTFSWQEAQ